ncbi:MAG: hypothetical protein SFY92_04470 [Verrucomicrobiae bacterium]|nr:hypothetical protein [Verrucomicrobiae bacterium]
MTPSLWILITLAVGLLMALILLVCLLLKIRTLTELLRRIPPPQDTTPLAQETLKTAQENKSLLTRFTDLIQTDRSRIDSVHETVNTVADSESRIADRLLEMSEKLEQTRQSLSEKLSLADPAPAARPLAPSADLAADLEKLNALNQARHDELLARIPRPLTLAEQEATFAEFSGLYIDAPLSVKRLYLTAMFTALPALRFKTFEFFFAQAQTRLTKLIESGEFGQIPVLLNFMTESVLLFGNTDAPFLPKTLASWVGEINDRVSSALREVASRELADGNPRSLENQQEILQSLPLSLLPAQTQDLVESRLEAVGEEIRLRDGSQALEKILTELQNPALADPDSSTGLQQVEIRILHLEFLGDGPTRELYFRVRHTFDTVRQRMLTARLIRQIFDNPERIGNDLQTLASLARHRILSGADLARLDEVIERLTPFIQSYESNLQNAEESCLPFRVDLSQVRQFLEAVPSIKGRSYNLWALHRIKKARTEYKRDVSLFKSKEDNLSRIRDLLRETIWRVDERQLDATVLGLFGQVRQQILDYIEEEKRIDFIREELEFPRSPLNSIVHEPGPP